MQRENLQKKSQKSKRKTRYIRKLAALPALLAIACLSLHCPVGGYTEPEPKLIEGDTAPPFTLSDRGGNPHSLQDMYGKKPLLLVFLSAHCPPCRMELKMLNGLKNFNSDRKRTLKFNVVMVTNASRDEIRALEGEDGPIRYTVLYDDEHAVARAYGVTAFPHNFLIDTDGRIIMVQLGYNSRMVDEINRRLGSPVTPVSTPGEDRAID